MPRLLQQIESHLIVKVIAKHIQKTYPTIPIYTIHDSIVTTASNQILVEQMMREAFTSYVGVSPTFPVEDLNPEIAEQYLEGLRLKKQSLSA